MIYENLLLLIILSYVIYQTNQISIKVYKNLIRLTTCNLSPHTIMLSTILLLRQTQ